MWYENSATLYVFQSFAFLQITVMSNFLQPISVIEGRSNASAHVIETACKPIMQ